MSILQDGPKTEKVKTTPSGRCLTSVDLAYLRSARSRALLYAARQHEAHEGAVYRRDDRIAGDRAYPRAATNESIVGETSCASTYDK